MMLDQAVAYGLRGVRAARRTRCKGVRPEVCAPCQKKVREELDEMP
jgi:hypothetical protein